jgi:hypothetical protein
MDPTIGTVIFGGCEFCKFAGGIPYHAMAMALLAASHGGFYRAASAVLTFLL